MKCRLSFLFSGWKGLLAFAFLLSVYPLSSETPISIGGSGPSLNISTNIEYRHRDQEIRLCSEEALQDLKSREWHLNPMENVLRVRKTAKGAWLRSTLSNDSGLDLTKRLVFLSVNVPNAELCSYDSKGVLEKMELSDHSSLSLRGLISPYPNFIIRIPAHTTKTYYIHLDAYEEITYINFPLYLMDESFFGGVSVLRNSLIIGCILSSVLGVLLSFVYWYGFRQSAFLSFAGMVLVQLSGFYLLHSRTVHSLIGWENKLGYYFYYLFLTTSYFFFYSHLYHLAGLFKIRIRSVWFFVLGCFFALSFLLVPLFTPWAEERFFLLLGGMSVLVLYFYYVHSFLFKSSDPYARAYLASWCIFLGAFFLKATYHFDYNPFNWIAIFLAPAYLPVHAVIVTACLRKMIQARIWEGQGENKSIVRKSKVASIDVEGAVSKMKQLLEVDKVYLRHELKEEHLAKDLGIGNHQVSEIIKTEFKNTFPGLINLYRVEEAKKLLLEFPSMTTNEVRVRAGYSSKSAFHLEFKKITGQNPNAYRKDLLLRKETSPVNAQGEAFAPTE
ncbi:helix-turn-helix domain-containing protein [Leptospira langatensis]|uniref:Helix-turn-helix domain-containing protein n=1 Tax=Leptospira langatensis TaxID=2484983 RepID=A0A5F1ZXN0_9LEPT|nr:helix-turn-helix domain-containing protein [Leptospira langatensis]TGK01213.1 helix-turn-helix domain-containing protein [Leptospira langatensis]TGL42337.1 helix-turn-helix domain-containing protein [Leptospira langatensis]